MVAIVVPVEVVPVEVVAGELVAGVVVPAEGLSVCAKARPHASVSPANNPANFSMDVASRLVPCILMTALPICARLVRNLTMTNAQVPGGYESNVAAIMSFWKIGPASILFG
jgi:hypothetical protein